ncbi:MAG: 16S rRNA (guanine(527)-N(7))-methyltransferase RsmG [Chloroflexi bacterium]|nr:16S rRNA (guanine(527)-N(7))-methyltransferase RsmG [Chloroflexota bacterium]
MITFANATHEFGIDLTSEQLTAFDIFYRELVAWNARMNLTAIIEHDQVVVKHFLDSLSVVPVLRNVIASEASPRSAQDTVRLIDIGTGAGFPGIPLKIALPNLQLTLLETTGKKVDFLKHLITTLNLNDAIAIQARAEDLGHDAHHREQYAVAVARAVANMATLSEYTLPFVRKGGVFIAQKGVNVEDELKQAKRALEILGGRVRKIVPVQLPNLEPRHIIVIAKIATTPETYPRRAGTPERKPIM